jgi:hypothetical protein
VKLGEAGIRVDHIFEDLCHHGGIEAGILQIQRSRVAVPKRQPGPLVRRRRERQKVVRNVDPENPPAFAHGLGQLGA